MKETYLNNLSKELDSVHAKNKEEILKKYEKRYDFGLESGMTEEEIEEKLGDPSEIAKEYQSVESDKKQNKKEEKTSYNLIVKTINDSVKLVKSSDNKLHIKFDFDDYDNYNITDNDKGVKVEYLKSKYFALNRKKPGEILIEVPENTTFDLAEITSASGTIQIDFINCIKLNISTTSGAHELGKIDTKIVNLASVNGAIKSDDINADRVTMSSVSGKIEAKTIDASTVIIDTISGDISIDATEGKLKITSITGNILINNTEYNSFKDFVKGVFK